VSNVRLELRLLEDLGRLGLRRTNIEADISALMRVNERLWVIEDDIRDKERAQAFDAEFIRLARAVYFENDERAAIKRRINTTLGSSIVEEKSYASTKLRPLPSHRFGIASILQACTRRRSRALGPARLLDRQIHLGMRIPQEHARHGAGQRQIRRGHVY
jgi:uncharacterized protein YkuJ